MVNITDLPHFEYIFEEYILPQLDLGSLYQLSFVSTEFHSLVLKYVKVAKCLQIPLKSRKSLKKHHIENITMATGSLRVLDLSGCLDGLSNETLCAILLQNDRITTLDISGCSKVSSKAFCDLLMKSSADPIPHLEHLLIDDCKSISGEIGKFLVHVNLKTLSLGGIWTTDDRVVEDFVTFFPNLENINLSRCYKITDVSMNHISRCTNLKILKISGCWRVGDRGLHRIMEYCPNITAMVIDDCRSISRRMMDILQDRGILVLEATFKISQSLKYKKDGEGDDVRAMIEKRYQTISSSIRNSFQSIK